MDIQAFIRNRIVVDNNGCWIWQGARNEDGYGVVGLRFQQSRRAHRLAYLAFIGSIPDNFQVDHLCLQRACVNPHHLDPVSNRTNTMRGQGFAASKAAQTHCVHGHPFDLVNTRFNLSRLGRIYRACRTCDRLRSTKRRIVTKAK